MKLGIFNCLRKLYTFVTDFENDAISNPELVLCVNGIIPVINQWMLCDLNTWNYLMFH